jgi:hypothetical protein
VAHSLLSARAAWLCLGVLIGLVIGAVLPQAPLHAVATDRQDNFAIATGMVDEGIEAVYMLDFLTGDLRAAVLNPNTRTFSSTFQRNVATDLKVEQGKNPRYLMVTGAVDLRGAGGGQFGNSALYIAELSTGNMGVFALPWNGGALNRPMNQTQPIVLLQTAQFRTAAVRGSQ